jgi:hypothetical protein
MEDLNIDGHIGDAVEATPMARQSAGRRKAQTSTHIIPGALTGSGEP